MDSIVPCNSLCRRLTLIGFSSGFNMEKIVHGKFWWELWICADRCGSRCPKLWRVENQKKWITKTINIGHLSLYYSWTFVTDFFEIPLKTLYWNLAVTDFFWNSSEDHYMEIGIAPQQITILCVGCKTLHTELSSTHWPYTRRKGSSVSKRTPRWGPQGTGLDRATSAQQQKRLYEIDGPYV